MSRKIRALSLRPLTLPNLPPEFFKRLNVTPAPLCRHR